jgi:hypothetical protein
MTNNEKQKTFGDIVGMEAEVPVGTHPDDQVECSDGTVRVRRDTLADCRGGAHGSDDDAHDSNVEIVTEILMAHNEWAREYTTENTDYPDGYAYICDEDAPNWSDRFVEHVSERLEDEYEFKVCLKCGANHCDDHEADCEVIADCRDDDDLSVMGDDCAVDYKDIATAVYERLSAGQDVEAEYARSEYDCYSGPGFCPYSLQIGEYHDQIEVAGHDELQDLHDNGKLDDVLDDVNCDVSVMRSKRRVKDEETGHYKCEGRETYMPYANHSDHPTIDAVHYPEGQWHYVISEESINDMIESELERRND